MVHPRWAELSLRCSGSQRRTSNCFLCVGWTLGAFPAISNDSAYSGVQTTYFISMSSSRTHSILNLVGAQGMEGKELQPIFLSLCILTRGRGSPK